MNTLPIRPPLIVHHMAAMDDQTAPPNSLEAIRACLEANAAFVEVDITALADGDYLLVHDPELDHETTGNGLTGECTAAQARTLRIRHKGNPTPYHAPVLSEVVTLFQQHTSTTRLQLDFKNMIPFTSDEPLQRLVKIIEPLGERVIVSTGADWQLRKLRAMAPWLDLGFDIHFYIDWDANPAQRDPREYPRHLGAYGYMDDHPIAQQRLWPTASYLADRCGVFIGLVPRVSTFYIDHKFLVRSLDDGFDWAKALHNAGIKLDAWTMDVTNPVALANAPRLLAAGVDQFTTNTPRGLAATLQSARS